MNSTIEETINIYSVLHLENQENWQALLAQALNSSELKVTSVNNFNWAKSALEKKPYDLALIDLHLNRGEHGNRLIAHILSNYPETRLALLSGTLSDKARKAIEEQELGLLYIPKDELLTAPERVRAKVEFIVHNNFPTQREQRALEAIIDEELSLNQVPQIHSEIDALRPDLFALRAYLAEALPSSQGLRERILTLTQVPSLYGADAGESYSRVHDYKGQWAIATDELSRHIQDDTQEAHRAMTLMLSRLVSLLDASQGDGTMNISQLFNREVGRIEQLYPDVRFTLDRGDSKHSDPDRYFISGKFRESLRILLSNAAEAYQGTIGEKRVEVDTLFLEGEVSSTLSLKIRNRGKPLPESLAKKTVFMEDLPLTTKATGTQFGLRRVLEIGGRMNYDLGFSWGNDETIAKIEFSRNGFQIRRLESYFPPSGTRVLLVDYSGEDYRYLTREENELRCSIEYVRSRKEFEDIATLYAKDYDILIIHPTAGYLDVAHSMQQKNPQLGILICSGYAPYQETARKLLPQGTLIESRMPSERLLKLWIHQHFLKGTHSTKR